MKVKLLIIKLMAKAQSTLIMENGIKGNSVMISRTVKVYYFGLMARNNTENGLMA